MKEETKRFEGLGTKIDPAMYEVLNACCDALGVDVYHLLQWFAYTIIRASAPMHELDPRIQKLLAMMESDVGWQQAFNIANPNGLKVAQAILILEQEGRKGFGAVMIDRPFFGDARQTECVDSILERVTEVTMRGIYRRLRLMGAKMDCQNLSDVLLTMIDAQTILDLDEGFRAELPGMGDYNYNGKQVAYGKKTKAKQHRTPDSVAQDQRIKFDDYDREVADYEVQDWEGEHRGNADEGYAIHGEDIHLHLNNNEEDNDDRT
jgi:hypothetical protein